MDTQLELIQTLIRINRDAMRTLAKVAETTSANYLHIDNAIRMLGEQFHFLLHRGVLGSIVEDIELRRRNLHQLPAVNVP